MINKILIPFNLPDVKLWYDLVPLYIPSSELTLSNFSLSILYVWALSSDQFSPEAKHTVGA